MRKRQSMSALMGSEDERLCHTPVLRAGSKAVTAVLRVPAITSPKDLQYCIPLVISFAMISVKVLRERGIGVLPDVYANGGGVIVSFFEWVQNQQTYRRATAAYALRSRSWSDVLLINNQMLI